MTNNTENLTIERDTLNNILSQIKTLQETVESLLKQDTTNRYDRHETLGSMYGANKKQQDEKIQVAKLSKIPISPGMIVSVGKEGLIHEYIGCRLTIDENNLQFYKNVSFKGCIISFVSKSFKDDLVRHGCTFNECTFIILHPKQPNKNWERSYLDSLYREQGYNPSLKEPAEANKRFKGERDIVSYKNAHLRVTEDNGHMLIGIEIDNCVVTFNNAKTYEMCNLFNIKFKNSLLYNTGRSFKDFVRTDNEGKIKEG